MLTPFHPYTASLHVGRRYHHHQPFVTIADAASWGCQIAACHPTETIRVKVARPQDGGPVRVCEITIKPNAA